MINEAVQIVNRCLHRMKREEFGDYNTLFPADAATVADADVLCKSHRCS